LPGPQRLRALPENMRPTPEVARRLTDSWQRLYQGIEEAHQALKSEEPVTRVQGVEEVVPGWSWPPDKLANSYRSLLVRSENPDEQKLFVILSRMRPWRAQFEPLYLHYGGAFIYPLGACLEAASLLRVARLVPDLGYYLLHPEAMGRLYLLGRLFVLLAQLGALWVLFDLGRRLSGPLTGFCAAALFCLCPFAVAESHTAKPHPYAAFWALAAMRYLFLSHGRGLRREYLLAGLCLGLAAGTNSSFVCLAFLPMLAWLLRRGSAPDGPATPRHAVLAMAVAGAVYAVTNPYVFLATRDFLWETTVYPSAVRHFDLEGSLIGLLGRGAVLGLGPVLYALSAGAVILALARGDAQRRTLALMCVSGFVVVWIFLVRFWGWVDASGLRFFTPFFGLTCLLAADLASSWKGPRWLKSLVLAAVFLDSGLRSWAYIENFRLDAGPRSTRAQAADWIDENIPGGATVGLLRYPQPAHTPPFRYDRYHLVIFESPELLKPGQRPDFLVVEERETTGIAPEQSESIRSFPTYHLGWGRVDAGNFANSGFVIYRRRGGIAALTSEKL
jgi:hypothetical protein